MTATTFEHLPTTALLDYANNSRTHTPEQVTKIAEAIKEFGFLNPVIVDGKNVIIAGHARVRAAKQLGLETVPCLRATHLTEAQQKAYVIADNRLALDAGWDDAILRKELHSLSAAGFNLNVTGMGEDELKRMVASSYTPKLDPERGSEQFQTGEMDKAQRDLANQFANAGKQDLVSLTCPCCGEDFQVLRKDVAQ